MADPVPLDIEEYLEEKVREYDDTFELREGSAFRDFFIKPLVSIIQPLRNDIETIRVLQSIVNFEQMTDEEFNSLVANYFLTRRSGSNAAGVARLFFTNPVATTVTQGSVVISANGLRFLVDEDTSITSSAMSVNVDGSLFYMDLNVTAESAGAEFNIDRGTLVSLENPVAGVVRVSNSSPFTGGIATESNFELFNRAQSAITVRNLINDRSILTTLLEQFDFVKAVVPIGFNDPEMIRDLETIVLPGPPQHPVDIHMGGKADVYVEVSSLEEASATVQTAPLIIDTNSDRGSITEIDFGFRKIAIQGGFFDGIEYLGDPEVDLLAFQFYTLFLQFNPESDLYELQFFVDAASYLPFPVSPPPPVAQLINLGRVQTDGSPIVEILDDRENLFSFSRPLISLDSVEVLDPVSLQPTGVELRDGLTTLVAPSVVADPGGLSDMARSRGSGDLHFAFVTSAGVMYSRLDSGANEIVAPTLVATGAVNVTNVRIVANLQEELHIFYLQLNGNLIHWHIDNSGTPISSAVLLDFTVDGVTTQFDVTVDNRANVEMGLINLDLGQPDPYYMRLDETGAITTALTNLESPGGNASDISVDFAQTVLNLEISGAETELGTTGSTTGLPDGEFTDLNADFNATGGVPGTQAVLAGDDLIILSGTGVDSSEQGVYSIASVDGTGTVLTLSGPPFIVTALPGSNIEYEIVRGSGGRSAVYSNNVTGYKHTRMMAFDENVSFLLGGQHVVLSDPRLSVDNTLSTVRKNPRGDNFNYTWVHSQTELQSIQLFNLTLATVSTTGDTQLTGLSRNFLDASNPFVPDDVGKFVSIVSGTGLTDTDFRLYKILDYVSAGNVLLDEPVTDGTAADINYTVISVDGERAFLAENALLSPITSVDAAVDSSNSLHIALVTTEDNSGTAYLAKFSPSRQPLLAPTYLQILRAENNLDPISIEVDDVRQPYVSWSSFSASSSQVQFAKFQAQEYAFVVNDLGTRLSIKEDNSIILDPLLLSQSLRFNFTWAPLVETVDQFVNDTVNRVVIGDYLAKHTFPAFADIELVYSGANAPTEEDATTLLEDFINSVGSDVEPPAITSVITRSTIGDTLEVSDLVDVLYDNGADSVRLGSELLVSEAQTNGTFREQRSIDKVTITRTAKFIARTVVARIES